MTKRPTEVKAERDHERRGEQMQRGTQCASVKRPSQ